MKYHSIIKLYLVLWAFILALPAIAQNVRTYQGVVLDEAGIPVIGATVKVADTATGTITDMDGKFTLEVPSGKQVEISYIGYIPPKISDLKQTKIV